MNKYFFLLIYRILPFKNTLVVFNEILSLRYQNDKYEALGYKKPRKY